MRKDVSSEVHCGECPFFKNEDVDGYGHCNIGKREGHCSDLCRYFRISCPEKKRSVCYIIAKNGDEVLISQCHHQYCLDGQLTTLCALFVILNKQQ